MDTDSQCKPALPVGNDCNVDAAWRYPDLNPSAACTADHIAFRRGVTVEH